MDSRYPIEATMRFDIAGHVEKSIRLSRESVRPLFKPLRRTGEGKLTGYLGRWAGLGPYYAMFPMEFALKTVRQYCPKGGRVLDPFAGRGTSIYAAAAAGRTGVGIEVHPAGWIYGQVKLRPASKSDVIRRMEELALVAREVSNRAVCGMPEFFRWCFSPDVLRFLLAARKELNWRRCSVDRTLMAFVLNNLHGDSVRSLSNQMHQSRSMAPDYSLSWWRSKNMRPKKKDPVAYLRARIEWRYMHGVPKFSESKVRLGDSIDVLTELAKRRERFDLLLTSPPYYAVVNYHYDQWLRLWLLGGQPHPVKSKHMSRGSFDNMIDYQVLLHKVFGRAALLLRPRAAIYVRTDAREFTLHATHTALQHAFPGRKIQIRDRPYQGETQTRLFGDKDRKPGEVDLVISAVR